jgi:cystathionine gamma-synthase
MHAATKYLGGHSDLIAGVLVAREDDAFWQRIRTVRAQLGGTLGSFEAWLLLRGMRTLYLRVRQASASAQRIAEHFAQHRAVEGCCTPACPARRATRSPKRQMPGGFGGMLSIRAPGRRGRRHRHRGARRTVEARHLAGRHREPDRAPRQRRRRGTPAPADLLRLSVGIEDAKAT